MENSKEPENRGFARTFTSGLTMATEAVVSRMLEIDEQIESLTNEKNGHLTMLEELERLQNKADNTVTLKTGNEKSVSPALDSGENPVTELPPAKEAPAYIPDEKESRKLANRIARLLEKQAKPMKSAEIRNALGLPNDAEFWAPVNAAMLKHAQIGSEGEKLQKRYVFRPASSTNS